MQTTRKQLGILIILAGVIIILLIIYFGFLKSKPLSQIAPTGTGTTTGQLPGTSVGTTTPSDRPVGSQQYNLSQEPAHQINAGDLEKIGMAFAERFGSYSNQSDYGNFTDLKIMMTDNMKTWVDAYIIQLKGQASSTGAYYGLTTQAVTATASSFDNQAGSAQVVVTVKQVVNTDKITGGQGTIRKLDLTFKKVGADWLVDKAYWEKK